MLISRLYCVKWQDDSWKAIVAWSRYYPGICQEGLRKKIWEPPEWESAVAQLPKSTMTGWEFNAIWLGRCSLITWPRPVTQVSNAMRRHTHTLGRNFPTHNPYFAFNSIISLYSSGIKFSFLSVRRQVTARFKNSWKLISKVKPCKEISRAFYCGF
jgi:hypothetical protein